MQSTDLNVKFKDFEILNVIQMSREHNSQRLITIGLRCEMLDSKKIEMIQIMPRERDTYEVDTYIKDLLTGIKTFETIRDGIKDGSISRDLTFEQLGQYITDEFETFDVRYQKGEEYGIKFIIVNEERNRHHARNTCNLTYHCSSSQCNSSHRYGRKNEHKTRS